MAHLASHVEATRGLLLLLQRIAAGRSPAQSLANRSRDGRFSNACLNSAVNISMQCVYIYMYIYICWCT